MVNLRCQAAHCTEKAVFVLRGFNTGKVYLSCAAHELMALPDNGRHIDTPEGRKIVAEMVKEALTDG